MPDSPAPARVPPGHAPPQQLTGFVGRSRELDELARLIESHRLVTLTGAGGSGKTRLAAEVVTRLGEARSIGWVDLAPLSDPAQLPRYVAAALGIGEEADRPAERTLVEQLSPHALLLVLDNCEHLVDAIAAFVQVLLLGCPRLRVLTTSREALGVAGETAWLVPPLELPAAQASSAGAIEASEAGQLFVARAREASAAFVLNDGNAADVAAICRRLDGIPLAIELAAARVKLLAPAQIARRLDDVFRILAGSRGALPRHRTLREAIDWSHALLDEQERVLFRRLGAFAGSFTLEAAESVCADEGCASDDVLDLMSALVDKSMVRSDPQPDEARFALLEPMRQYALEKLRDSGEEAAVQERHARFYTALAESAEPHIRGGIRSEPRQVRLERDHANLRAARAWCAEGYADDARVTVALRLDAALLWFHFALGLFAEPRRRIEEALAHARDDVPPVVRGRALAALGSYAIWQADYPAVPGPLAAAVEILGACDDADALAYALLLLGTAVGMAGDRATADVMFDRAEAALGGRDGAIRSGYASTLVYAIGRYWRAIVAQTHGDVVAARGGFEAAIAAGRQFGDHPTIAHPLAALVRLLALQGELDEAQAALAESLPIHARNDDRWGLVQALDGAAIVAERRGDSAHGARLLGAADAFRERVGVALPPHEMGVREQIAASLRATLGAAAFEEALRAGRALSVDQVVAEATGCNASPVSHRASSAPPEPPTAPPSGLRVHALGPLRIERDGAAIERDELGGAKPRELLLFLLTREGGATREQVGLALWPELPDAKVANNFHVTLHRLRRALGDADTIELRDERYAFAPGFEIWLDASAFEREASAALTSARRGRAETAPLVTAAALYRGAFLEDEVVGDWAEEIRDRLHRIAIDTLMAAGDALVAADRAADAADAYRRVIALENLHEPAYRGAMTALARAGDRAGALRLYQQLVALLRDELDVEPDEETRAAHERLHAASVKAR